MIEQVCSRSEDFLFSPFPFFSSFRHGSIDGDRSIVQRHHHNSKFPYYERPGGPRAYHRPPPPPPPNGSLFFLIMDSFTEGWLAWDQWCYKCLAADSMNERLPEATRHYCQERLQEGNDQRRKGLRSYLLWNLSCSVPEPVLTAYHWASPALQSLFDCLASAASPFWESIWRPGARRSDVRGRAHLPATRIPALSYRFAGIVRQRVASNSSIQAAIEV